jgi:molybdopterin converting factor small subunit
MKLRVLLFASWADALQSPALDVDVREGATAGDLLRELELRAAGSGLPRPAVAVNQRIAAAATTLAPGDEVAIIPPVSGG